MVFKGLVSKTPLGKDRGLAPAQFPEPPAYDYKDSVPATESKGSYKAQEPQIKEAGARPPVQGKPFSVKGGK